MARKSEIYICDTCGDPWEFEDSGAAFKNCWSRGLAIPQCLGQMMPLISAVCYIGVV